MEEIIVQSITFVFENFPAENVPDGNVDAPHHGIWGPGLAIAGLLFAWDMVTDREPWMIGIPLSVSLFAFLYTWELYPVLGAVMYSAGLLGATGGLYRFRRYADEWVFWLVTVGVVAGWDDWASHAIGLWTPLDWAWGLFI